MSKTSRTLGIDCGATLTKLVLRHRELECAQVPAGDLDAVRAFAAGAAPDRVVATGGGASALGAQLAGVRVEREDEFQAWGRGAPLLAARQGIALPERFLVVSLGTGTSILCIAAGRAQRIGGSAFGGGTLLGLGRLLLGVESFRELSELAAKGDRRRVDLLVGDIYTGADTPLPRDLNAASFAKLASREPADLAHALVGMLGENVALLCGHLAREQRATAVLFGGSTLLQNPALALVLGNVTAMLGLPAHVLELAPYAGAAGCAAAP
jgi:type II pantothenate kinase